jgi:hypothetical protein
MSKPESFPTDKIYVPVKRKKTIKPELVREIAESILEIGQQTPILVRPDEDRFVLVEGLHRLEACKALGETTVIGVLVGPEHEHHRALLSDSSEAAAERDKMARLRQLRLDKEAAERSAAASPAFLHTEKTEPRTRSQKENRASKASRSQLSEYQPRTLSEWISQQKRDGGRY